MGLGDPEVGCEKRAIREKVEDRCQSQALKKGLHSYLIPNCNCFLGKKKQEFAEGY